MSPFAPLMRLAGARSTVVSVFLAAVTLCGLTSCGGGNGEGGGALALDESQAVEIAAVSFPATPTVRTQTATRTLAWDDRELTAPSSMAGRFNGALLSKGGDADIAVWLQTSNPVQPKLMLQNDGIRTPGQEMVIFIVLTHTEGNSTSKVGEVKLTVRFTQATAQSRAGGSN